MSVPTNTFDAILDELQRHEDIIINWPEDEPYPETFKHEIFYPEEYLDKMTQMRFLFHHYPRIKWDVPVIETSVNDAVRYLLDVIDISRSQVVNYQTIANNMNDKKMLAKFYRRAIIEIAEVLDTISMTQADIKNTYLEGYEEDTLKKLYFHWTFLNM
jgi:hypothetical protein